jgi:N-acetylmuramoyl-L-alanine amidase
MNLNIKKSFIQLNNFSRPGKKLKGIKGIVIHWTACPGAPAKNISNYFGRLANQKTNDKEPDRYASAHYAVDDNEIVQIIPEDEMAYHVGSKTYTDRAEKELSEYPNDCTIGIEMCVDRNGNITEKTFENTINLTVDIIIRNKMKSSSIFTHKEVVGWKDCPMPWIKNPAYYEKFKSEVFKKVNAIRRKEKESAGKKEVGKPLSKEVKTKTNTTNKNIKK